MVSFPLASIFSRAHGGRTFVHETSYFLFAFVTWIPAVIFFNEHVGQIADITGPSMYPYFNTDVDRSLKRDVCWIKRYGASQIIERGMIISFWSPLHPDVKAVKRVIGLEGDTVITRAPYPYPTCQVPSGHVWVEGDGSHGGKPSLDSNHYGPISRSLITGTVTYMIWPWSSFGPIRWWEFKPKTKVLARKSQSDLRCG